MTDLMKRLQNAPVIAAVRDARQLARAVASPAQIVFLLGGDLFTLPDMLDTAKAAGKLAFIHLDLVEGVSRDAAGVRWLARSLAPAGVLSTRASLLKTAAEEGLFTVLRMFMVDSSSMETGIRMVKSAQPDLVEVMPALVLRAVQHLSRQISQPVIAGGMLEIERDVQNALAAGALAASTSSEALWKMTKA